MARVAKSSKAHQSFRGGLNSLSTNPWLQNIGNGCCEVAPAIDQDRLNPTINPENALVHSRPFGNRLHWRFSELDDTTRRQIVSHINTNGVGAQLEIIVIPTFGFLHSVHTVTLAEESGLVFSLKTRNGTLIPSDQLIKVSETDSGDGCGEVARVKAAADKNAIGALAGASRVHNFFVAGNGGEFALEADVLILEVVSMPADAVIGSFDILVHSTTVAAGRSESAR
jgi:hypothetical protein